MRRTLSSRLAAIAARGAPLVPQRSAGRFPALTSTRSDCRISSGPDHSTGRTAVVRTRMPGGVGGAAPRGAPLSRSGRRRDEPAADGDPEWPLRARGRADQGRGRPERPAHGIRAAPHDDLGAEAGCERPRRPRPDRFGQPAEPRVRSRARGARRRRQPAAGRARAACAEHGVDCRRGAGYGVSAGRRPGGRPVDAAPARAGCRPAADELPEHHAADGRGRSRHGGPARRGGHGARGVQRRGAAAGAGRGRQRGKHQGRHRDAWRRVWQLFDRRLPARGE